MAIETVEWSRMMKLPTGKRTRVFRRIAFRDGVASFTPEEVAGMLGEVVDRGFGLSFAMWGFGEPDGRGYRPLSLEKTSRLLRAARYERVER